MLAPKDIAKKTVEVGKTKAALSIGKMLVLGIFAGAFIALAGVGATFGNAYVGKLAGACIFPVGLIMVVIAGSELFTGNNLMIAAVLKGKITWQKMLFNWFLVFLGNFVGAVLVAVLVVYSGALEPVSETAINAAVAKNNLGFLEALLRGVLCNFLVCIAVWMAFGADTVGGKILAIFGPIMLFVLCGFEHSIANMYYGTAGSLMTDLSLWGFVVNNLLPVTIGNIIGGAGFVGAGYYLAWLADDKKSK